MENYKYIIIGGGLAGYSASRGVREIDSSGSIIMFSEENIPPYDRPPLSKGLWKGKDFDEIWCKPESLGVTTKLNDPITTIDPVKKTITDSGGVQYKYEKLLIATGVSPRKLPFGGDLVNYYRTVADYKLLKDQTEHHDNFIVIGGGFIGSEIAAALAMNRKKVTIIFPEDGIGFRIFSHATSEYINQYYRNKGVNVQNGLMIVDIQPEKDGVKILTKDKASLTTEFYGDAVIAGIGTIPNTALAETAGIKVSNGIEVNELLQTNYPDIFSAGDVTNYFDQSLQTRRRVEHENNASQMGLRAGKNMAGEPSKYVTLPFFYSDLFELGYEAVGDLDSRLEMFEDWVDPFKKGVIYYLKDQLVKGVLLWNTWEKVNEARALIKAAEKVTPQSLKNRIHG